MPRTARIIEPDGAIYHVTSRGNNRAPVFLDDDDFRVFYALMMKCKKTYPFWLYHYSIMNNHFHLEIEPRDGVRLADIMKRLKQSYSLHYKKKYGFNGQLWQGRFHSRIITDETYLTTCGIYIELNPVRAGITDAPEKYLWSSYRRYAYGESDPLVDLDPVYLALGKDEKSRQTEYRGLTDMWQQNPIDKKEMKKYF